jgi:hypothetical protein
VEEGRLWIRRYLVFFPPPGLIGGEADPSSQQIAPPRLAVPDAPSRLAPERAGRPCVNICVGLSQVKHRGAVNSAIDSATISLLEKKCSDVEIVQGQLAHAYLYTSLAGRLAICRFIEVSVRMSSVDQRHTSFNQERQMNSKCDAIDQGIIEL